MKKNEVIEGINEVTGEPFEKITRDSLKEEFDDALRIFLTMYGNLLAGCSQADSFRAHIIEIMMKDVAKFRDSLVDTYDMPWSEYSKKFKEMYEKITREMGTIPERTKTHEPN